MDARLLVILSLVAAATAGPLNKQDSNECATKCIESTKYKYNPGTTYVYDYRVDTDSSILGAFEHSARLTLQTSVNIEVLSPCEFALQLRNTRLFHTDASKALKSADRENEFRSEVEGSPLRFSFQNGIVDHVCAEKEDSVRSLNLKKGILSAFQNSMDDLTQSQNVTETDVSGTCKAEYKLVSNGYYTTEVKKVKDILSCTGRLDFLSMVQSTPYNVPSDLQNIPIMKTSHECEQTFENGGVLKSSVCKENHVYRPFANGQNGGATKVTQTLTYQTYRNGISQTAGNIQSRSSLTFDHSADHPSKEQSRMAVEKKLGEICDTTIFDVRPETPRLFTELVSAMKGLEKQDLKELHLLLKTKSMCPINEKAYKFFHDALPMLGNTASISLMTELINAKDVSGLEASAWLTSLAFIQQPTTSMLMDVKTLIDNAETRMDALLPVSSMINNFCKKMSTCNQDFSVISLMASIEKNIDYGCDASGKNFELTLLTLKAIGNAGHVISTIPVLNKCLSSSSNPLEIRISAAEAFRRMPCATEDNNLWEALTDKSIDSELRINAYLALIRCPTEQTLGKIAVILNSEEDEQVGAFVYSHLTNLKETSDPHKQEVADAINSLDLNKDFELSALKFSRNFEVSALLNKINTGVTAESNLIWSNKVQLPRAVSANLTVQLFGQSINVLDFGGRFEGLEYLIRNIFGPYVKADEKDLKIDANNLKGSFYGRMFGNEMMFMHSQTTKSLFGSKNPSWLDMLIKLADDQHVALTQSVQFMDICMVIPSSAGLPIHMRVNGTATVNVDMNGKMDLRKVGSAPRSMDVNGEIRPSAALELTGSMFVDSFVTKTGLRMRNTMHTSTAMKGRIQLHRGQQLNVEIDTPEEKTEVFGASSRFVLLHDNMEQEQEMIKDNRNELKSCSNEQLTKITGMEICGELSFPNASMKTDSPYFPFTGPSSVSVTVFKRDSHSGYKLFAKRVENKKASVAQLFITTPGSQIDRTISVDMSLNYKKQDVAMNLATPWKKLALNGNLVNLKDMKSLSGNVIVDEKDTYAMAGEMKISHSKNKVQVNPMIELRRPGVDNIQLTGFMSMEKSFKALNMEMSLSGVSKLPYTIKSALINKNKEKSLQAGISLDGKKEYNIKASSLTNMNTKMTTMRNELDIQTPERSLITLSNTIDYRLEKSLRTDSSLYIYRILKKPATLKVNLVKSSRKRNDNYKASLNLKAHQVSGSIACNVNKKSNGFMSMTSKIDYTIPKVARNTINLSGKLIDRSTNAYKSYIVQSNVAVQRNPEYNSNMRVQIGHKKKLSSVSLDLKYGDNFKDKTKRVYFYTSLNKKIADLKNAVVNYKLKAQVPAHKIALLVDGKHEHNGKSLDSSLKFAYAPRKEFNVGINMKDYSNKLMKMNGNAFISWPGKKYIVESDLSQNSAKQFAHSLGFQSNAGTKHTITSSYNMPKADSHDLSFDLNLHNMRPVSIRGSTKLNWKNFAASGELKRGQDVYGINTLSKISTKAPNGKLSVELIHPARRITFDVNGGKSHNNKYEGNIEAAWNVDNDKSQKMSLNGIYFNKMSGDSTSLGGNLNFRSPFEKFESLTGSIRYGSDSSKHAMNGKFSWAKSQQIISTMTVKKPISLNNVQLNGNIKTPFKGFKSAEIDIAHKLDSELNTVVKGDLGKETAKLTLQGKELSNGYKGNMILKSTIKNAESVALSASHTGNDGSCANNAELNYNGKVYGYDLTMSHSGNGWQRKTSGNLMLTLNKQKIATHWNHKNTDAVISSTLSSKWNKQKLWIDLTGSHKLSSHRYITGAMKVKSPWNPIRDIEFNLDHKHGTGLINSIASIKQDSKKKASSVIKYTRGQNTADFDFSIDSPFNKELSGKLSANYDRYPMSTSAELKLSPKMKGTLEGSVNLARWSNADLNMKMTSPSGNVMVKASNKKENGEFVSNLNLDYGMRQNIDVESRISSEDNKKMFRFKLSSPFKQIKSVNTGFNFNGLTHNFDSTVDFELLPSIGKFDGAMNWQYDNELNGKIRLDTPFPKYPYFELSTSSKKNGEARKSHIQAEYYPGQVFSLDSNYKLELPLSFDATIMSPYPEFNDIAMSLQHNMDDSSIKSHGEVQYQSGKKIEADFSADWASGIESNLEVKTPFNGYEANKISLRHRGQMKDFNCHGEINVAEQNVVADASFKSGYSTSGAFTFSSPIPGFEQIDFVLKKKGNMRNMKGSVSLNVNNDKYQTIFNSRLNQDALKSSLNIMTPHTETFKFNLDHAGLLESFTNKIGLNYGRKVDIDTVTSFDVRGNDVNGKSILRYKLNSGRNTVRLAFSKSGSLEDVTLTTTGSYNKNDVTVTGSLRTIGGVDGSIQIKTPFNNFKKTGMTMTYSGDLTDFTGSTNINYMDRKNIDGKLQLSTSAGFKLSGELTTPFKDFESSSVEFHHDVNAYSGISGNGRLTTTICEFGTGELSYSKSGNLDDLAVSGSVVYNGKNMAELKSTHKMQNGEVHSMCLLTSAATPEFYLSVDHSGDSFSFDTKAVGKVGENTVTSTTNMKRGYNSINADSSIIYKFAGQRQNKASITVQKDGPLDNCNMEISGKLNQDEVKLTASRSGPLNKIHMSGSASYNKDSIAVTGSWKNTENIEGNLKVLTPFKKFNNFGIVFSHAGELKDFTSSLNIDYLDNKQINGKVELRANSLDNVKFVSQLTTPFEDFKFLHMKFNNKYNRYTLELSGNAAIDTSIAQFGTASISYTKSGSLSNLDINGNVLRNGVEIAELLIKNSLQGHELHTSFECKSTKMPQVLLTLDHKGDITEMKTSARAKVGNKNIINGQTTLSQRSGTVDAEGKFMYTIKGFGSDEMILNVHKEGKLNNFNVEITGRHGSKSSKLVGNFKNEGELSGDLTVNTPIDGYKNIGVSFKHSGAIDRFNCEGKMNVKDGEEFSGKVEFYRHQYKRIMAVVEFNTPIVNYEFTKFEYRHEGQSDSFACSSSLQYGNSQRISYDLSTTASPKPQFTVTLKVPKQEYMAAGSYENQWPKYSVSGKVDAGEGRSVSLTGSLDASSDIVGMVTLSTPVKNFNNVGINFHYSLKSNGIDTEGSITFMDNKAISGKVQAAMNRKGGNAIVEVRTPFLGYEFTRYEAEHVSNKKMMKSVHKLNYGDNKRINVDANLKLKSYPKFSLTISSPFSKDIEAFVSLDNSWPKCEIICKLSPGNGDKFTLDGSFDASQDISSSLKIGTPFVNFNNIGMNFIHSGNVDKFVTEGKVNYMDGEEIFGKVNFYRYMWRRIDASVELTTPFNGMENSKAEFNFEDNSNSISTTAAVEYKNGQKLNGNVKITYSPNYEVQVTLNTPFRELNVIRAQAALDLTAPNYEVLSSLNYGYNQAYSAGGKLNFYSVKLLDGSFEVNTPLNGFESTIFEYQHKIDASEVEGSVAFTYDNGKKISCDIKSVISPNFDGTIIVKTPFRGYETMQGSATFDSSYNKFETSSSLNLGQGNIFSMSSEMDYSIEPMKVATKVSTPFKDFRNIELVLTHEGTLSNFKCTGFFSSPITNHINAKTSLRYESIQDMSAAASLQSSLEGYDDLKAEWKTSDVAGEMKTNAVLGWTSGQQISYDGTFRKQDGWSEDKMQADVSVSTPFVAVRNLNLRMDHSAQTDSYVEKMNFELNGDNLLDFDAEYKFNDKKSAELIVRQPWPMHYTASKSSNDGTLDAEVFVNWNRNEPRSNVRMQASITDKSDSNQVDNALDFSIEHVSRKVGVVHKFSQKSSELSGNGYIYWNSRDDNKVSYALQLNNNSRRRKQMVDGSFKLGLPTRTLGLTGSYSKNAASLSTDAAFSWDADRDDTKQIGVKTNANFGESVKGDVTLSLPTLRKEIRVDGEVMLNNGRVILDTKTDISYSKDSRKTLTLTSKLEDISTRNSHFNYSLVLGVKHPLTNVDIEMNSHLGKSEEKMTFGMATNYMTRKSQMKNVVLLSEINLLKKQMSVQAFNPMNRIELVGDIVSEKPFKARMLNKIDDIEAFRSDMTIDTIKKSFIFNTFFDTDMLTLTAKYPNNTAFRVDFTRHTPRFDQEEALMAVRLNTSNLLHTRLAWRPDMLKDFQEYALPKVMVKAESAVLALKSINEAFADELAGKYAAITNELSEELRPLISALEGELAFVAEKMNEVSQDIRNMYYNNDFYIQNMGVGVLEVQAKLEKLIQSYTSTYTQVISSLRENLDEMSRYHLGARYKHFVTQTAGWLVSESMNSLASFELYMAETDLVLKEYKNTMLEIKKKAMDTVLNATYVDYLADSVRKIQTVDVSPYISSFDIPTQYTNIASEIPSKIHAKLNNVLDKVHMGYLKERLNEVYQQSLWAYNYWQLEENIEKHAQSILNTLKDIIEEELKEYSEELKTFVRNPITVWDLKHGEIQADIPLPVAVQRLDQMPNVKPMMKKIEKFTHTYLPNEKTWNNIVESVSDMWPAQSNKTGSDLDEQLTQYKPSKAYRKKGRKYRVKKSRQ